jgi:hemerythrin-like domain-containing protein
MKRHKSLYPLSHDHHHALVQARNLRIAFSDPSLSSFDHATGDFIAFWDSHLELHFRQEEEILLPVFSKYSSADRSEILETLKQHLEIRQAIGQLRTKINQGIAPTTESLQLADYLEQHIRYEENYLFSAIEEVVPEEELWEINRLLTEK